MKKHIKNATIALAAGVLMLSATTGKSQSFDKGTSSINLGVGFGYSINYYTGGGVSASPVISGSYEYGALTLGPGTLGLGLAVGYQGASYSYSDYYGDTWSDKWVTTSFGIRGMYHWNGLQSDKYDIYGGIQLTYVHYGFSETATGPFANVYNYGSALSSSFYPYLVVGGRYLFTNNIGVFAELGYDICYFKLGLNLKF